MRALTPKVRLYVRRARLESSERLAWTGCGGRAPRPPRCAAAPRAPNPRLAPRVAARARPRAPPHAQACVRITNFKLLVTTNVCQ